MRHRYLKNVTSLKLNADRCTGCSKCIEVCPHKVLGYKGGKAEIIDKDSCMECGACSKNCPFSAIEVKPGVGCVTAIIMGWLKGTEPNCDCSGGNESNSSGCC